MLTSGQEIPESQNHPYASILVETQYNSENITFKYIVVHYLNSRKYQLTWVNWWVNQVTYNLPLRQKANPRRSPTVYIYYYNSFQGMLCVLCSSSDPHRYFLKIEGGVCSSDDKELNTLQEPESSKKDCIVFIMLYLLGQENILIHFPMIFNNGWNKLFLF